MKISTVIPCYNAEEYIEETINSVLNQTYKNIEIICVDNGSIDRTFSIIEKLSKKNSNIFLFHEKEKGASNARRKGLNKTTGDFIQFLDADDIIHSEKFEKQLNYMLLNKLDIVVSDRKYADENLENILETHLFENIEEKSLTTSIARVISSGNPLYRKSKVIEIGGYLATLKYAQDWEFHIRLMLSKPKLGYLKGFFFTSRKVEGSLSSNYIKVSNISCQIIEEYKSNFIEERVYEDQSVLSKIIFTYLMSYLYANSKERFWLKKELFFWYKKGNGISAFSGASKIFIRMFGFRFLIWIKSILINN